MVEQTKKDNRRAMEEQHRLDVTGQKVREKVDKAKAKAKEVCDIM